MLCENCINLNYAELVHSAFQVYSILLFCLFILLIFESLTLKLQLKNLLYLLKKIVTYHGNICNFVLYLLSLLKMLSYFHNIKNKKEEKQHYYHLK